MLIQVHPSNAVIVFSFLENQLTKYLIYQYFCFPIKSQFRGFIENNINEDNHFQRGKDVGVCEIGEEN